MPDPDATVRLLSPEGELILDEAAEPYRDIVHALTDEQLREFHRHMVVIRRFDVEAANLQRQGQLGLWIPSLGQEAAQVGSAFATRPQDHIFPSYREHAVARIRGVDPVRILELLRGHTHGGWHWSEFNNLHIYNLVIAAQTQHATGYAMGVLLDGDAGTGDPERDTAVLVYFGDGASSQGDANEAMIFAASFQTPQLFFLQNNHWAISVPSSVQSRTPFSRRAAGFGLTAARIDGNDVLASYAVSRRFLEDARGGAGPHFIEALTYRMGAHTSSDDPTRYRTQDETDVWGARDPVTRFDRFLRKRGADAAFFAAIDEEAADVASDARRRTLELVSPGIDAIFDGVYAEPHPRIDEQRAWLHEYEAQFGDAQEGPQ